MILNEVRERGYAALLKELEPVGRVRFIQRLDTGKGTCSQEWPGWLCPISHAELRRMLADVQKQP